MAYRWCRLLGSQRYDLARFVFAKSETLETRVAFACTRAFPFASFRAFVRPERFDGHC